MWERAMKWLHVAVLFVFLNVLWLLGTLLGGVVFSLIPSTIAILKVLQLPRIFDNDYSYHEIIGSYYRFFKEAYKHNKVFLFLPIMIATIAVLELQMITQNVFLQATFQIPLTILLVYVVIIIFHVSYLATQLELITSKQYKLLLLSPLIFNRSTILILVVMMTLTIIALIKGWMLMVFFSLVIYAASQLVGYDYKSKGLIQ